MYQILAASAANAAAASLADTPWLPDPSFPPNDNHLFVLEQYEMLALYAGGVSLTQVQLSCPTWDTLNTPQVYPVNLSLAPPGNPQLMDFRKQPIPLPVNEQVILEMSNDLASGTEQEFLLLWMRPVGGRSAAPTPQPQYGWIGRITAEFQVTVTLVAGAWTNDAELVNVNPIKGGTYCVLGARVICGDAVAYRMNFVKSPLVNGRKLYPGNLVEAAYGNVPLAAGDDWLGPLGYFDTVQFPYMALLGAAAAASATYTVLLDMLYVSSSLNQIPA